MYLKLIKWFNVGSFEAKKHEQLIAIVKRWTQGDCDIKKFDNDPINELYLKYSNSCFDLANTAADHINLAYCYVCNCFDE